MGGQKSKKKKGMGSPKISPKVAVELKKHGGYSKEPEWQTGGGGDKNGACVSDQKGGGQKGGKGPGE